MEANVVSEISAKAEIKKYTLVGDDIYVKRYTKDTIPDWYRNMIASIIEEDATISDLGAAIDYLETLPTGYNQLIYQLQEKDTLLDASLESLSTQSDTMGAAISNLQITKVDSTQSEAIARNTIGAYFVDGSAAAWFDAQVSTYASNIASNAQSLSTLNAVLGNQEVRIDDLESVSITTSGWAASASKLITAPDGSITGWEFADGSEIQSEFKIHTANFSISDGTTGYKPFRIVGNEIFLDAKVTFSNVDGELDSSRIINSAGWSDDTAALAAQDTANDSYALAQAAELSAISAANDASSALVAAQVAQGQASLAIDELTLIMLDDKLTINEKPQLIHNVDILNSERAELESRADTFGITAEKSAYVSAINTMNTYLGGLTTPYLWSSLSGVTYIPITNDFYGSFKEVHLKRQTLLNAIAQKAKTLADTAQSAASAAQSTANSAQTAANNAQSTANTASIDATAALDQLSDMASDDILSPVEKPSVIKEKEMLFAEQSGIDTQATSYGITTEKTMYDNAVTALGTYLAGLTAPVYWDNVSGDTAIVGSTLRTKFKDVYAARQTLLNKISAQAKVLADAAQSTANLKNRTYRQATAPASGMISGDLWIDTDDNNKQYWYDGSSWLVSSPIISSGGNVTFYQTTQPTAFSVWDTWYDTDDNYKQWAWNGTSWVNVTIDAALAINNGITTVNGAKLTTGSITASQIAADAITASKILAGTITADRLALNTITAGYIATGAITADKIGAGQITADKLSVTSLSAISSNIGTITAGTINAAVVNAGTINLAQIPQLSYSEVGATSTSTTSFTSTGSFSIVLGVSGTPTAPYNYLAGKIRKYTITFSCTLKTTTSVSGVSFWLLAAGANGTSSAARSINLTSTAVTYTFDVVVYDTPNSDTDFRSAVYLKHNSAYSVTCVGLSGTFVVEQSWK